MTARDLLAPVRDVVRKHKSLATMMDEAVRECIAEGRANPANPLVCVLDKPWTPSHRQVPQKWYDERAEHLAIKRDAQS